MHNLNLTLLLAAQLLIGSSICKTVSVKTRYATLTGLFDPSFGADVFVGVPYAQSPIDSGRLQPSLPVKTNQGALNVTGPTSNQCIQFGNTVILPLASSEDCLTLDIVRPVRDAGKSNTSSKLWPVYVFIHG